ncbi:hypothetical protein LWI28_000122 [Acer negundo]|uniref:Uncharacterized protein n=1 Tax=Acer negundo TaxID=4023 RepID=A0AAD5JBI7_ACENE|nr:hypothetical protein LWI28_000122 [Acer negundo]
MEAVKDTQATLETRGSKASQRAEVMNWDGTYSWLDYTRLQARPSKPHRHVHKNPPEICLLVRRALDLTKCVGFVDKESEQDKASTWLQETCCDPDSRCQWSWKDNISWKACI